MRFVVTAAIAFLMKEKRKKKIETIGKHCKTVFITYWFIKFQVNIPKTAHFMVSQASIHRTVLKS